MKIGLTGLTGAGKTTIFGLLTQTAGGDGANLGSVRVPDERLTALSAIYNPQRTVQTEIACTKLPTTPQKEELFAGQVLQMTQKMDALMLVVRAFESPYGGLPPDALGDLQKITFDMNFQDISILDKRITSMQSSAKSLSAGSRGEVDKNIIRLQKIQGELEKGVAVRAQSLDKADLALLSDTFLVSSLPLLVILNISEQDIAKSAELEAQAQKILGTQNAGVSAICAKLESELAELGDEQSGEFRTAMGGGEPGLARMIKLAYQTMGLISFLTVGTDEVRAWAIKAGSTAVSSAKKIHSDIERGFIRAEVVGYADFIAAGDMATARKNGTLRREGRDYIVADGDIINFLFSV